jgi:hypothetical protein
MRFCGERGIRTPGGVTLNGFQDRRNRPLCHLSAAKVIRFFEIQEFLLWYNIIFPKKFVSVNALKEIFPFCCFGLCLIFF